jgi:hypothetical protein
VNPITSRMMIGLEIYLSFSWRNLNGLVTGLL